MHGSPTLPVRRYRDPVGSDGEHFRRDSKQHPVVNMCAHLHCTFVVVDVESPEAEALFVSRVVTQHMGAVVCGARGEARDKWMDGWAATQVSGRLSQVVGRAGWAIAVCACTYRTVDAWTAECMHAHMRPKPGGRGLLLLAALHVSMAWVVRTSWYHLPRMGTADAFGAAAASAAACGHAFTVSAAAAAAAGITSDIGDSAGPNSSWCCWWSASSSAASA